MKGSECSSIALLARFTPRPVARRFGTRSALSCGLYLAGDHLGAWAPPERALAAQEPDPTRVIVVTLIKRNPRPNLITIQVSPSREKLHRNGATVSWVP